jgi:ribosomal protein L22
MFVRDVHVDLGAAFVMHGAAARADGRGTRYRGRVTAVDLVLRAIS